MMKTSSKIAVKHMAFALAGYWVIILILTGFYQRTTEIDGAESIVAAIFTGVLFSAVREAYTKGKQDAQEPENQ